jgi:hypothetical protein
MSMSMTRTNTNAELTVFLSRFSAACACPHRSATGHLSAHAPAHLHAAAPLATFRGLLSVMHVLAAAPASPATMYHGGGAFLLSVPHACPR